MGISTQQIKDINLWADIIKLPKVNTVGILQNMGTGKYFLKKNVQAKMGENTCQKNATEKRLTSKI